MPTQASPSVLNLPFTLAEEYVANNDATADVSAEFALFMDACRADKSVGWAMRQYRLDSQVTLTLEGTGEGEHASFRGGGRHSRSIQCNSAAGGIRVTGSGAGRQQTVEFHDFHFVPTATDSGVGLHIDGNAGGVSIQSGLTMSNVYYGATDDSSALDFAAGPTLNGLFHAKIDGFSATQNSGATTKWDHCVSMVGCYAVVFNDWFINVKSSLASGGGALVGIKSVGTTEEGFVANNIIMNGADVGVDVYRTGREPGFYWSKGHINHRHIGMRLNGIKYGYIDAVSMYSNDPLAGQDTIDFLLQDVDGLTIMHPSFRASGDDGKRRHFWLEPEAGKAGAVVRNITIVMKAANLFSDSTVPPIYCNGATNVTIELPRDMPEVDFVNYATRWIEMGPAQDPAEIKVKFTNGIGMYSDTSTAGPSFELVRYSGTPANGDDLGQIRYMGMNSAAEETAYAATVAEISNVTNGAEDGVLNHFLKIAGSDVKVFGLLRPAADSETAMFLLVRDGTSLSLQRVTLGADDSGTTGKRILEVPNGA